MEIVFKKSYSFSTVFLITTIPQHNDLYNLAHLLTFLFFCFFQGKDDVEPKNPEDCTLHTS